MFKIIKTVKTSYQIKFSNTGRFLVHTLGTKTIVYDKKSWEQIQELVKPSNPGTIKFSKNDDYLYIKNTVGTLYVYETNQFQVVKVIKSNRKYQLLEGDFALMDIPFVILDIVEKDEKKELVLINLEIGEFNSLFKFEDSITAVSFNQFIETERTFLFTTYYLNNERTLFSKIIKVKDPQNTLSVELVENHILDNWEGIVYNSLYNGYIAVKSNKLFLITSNFKDVLIEREIVIDETINELGYFQYINQSENEKYIILTYSEVVIVIEAFNLNVVLIEKLKYACFAEFNLDDEYILIGTWNKGYVIKNELF